MPDPAPIRVLLTGASGFVGSQILRALCARHIEVHAVARRRVPGVGPHPGGLPTWHRVDLLDGDDHHELVKRVKPTHLIHSAWYVDPKDYLHSDENWRWVDASMLLLRSCAEQGVQNAMFLGSCAEYDWTAPNLPALSETAPLRPTTPYARAKCALRSAVVDQAMRRGFRATWARLFFLLGAGESRHRFVGGLLEALRTGTRFEVRHGALIRDYSSSHQVGEALAEVAIAGPPGDLNVASGSGVSLAALATTLAEAMGRPDLVRLKRVETTSPPRIVADVTRLHASIGSAPLAALDEIASMTAARAEDAGDPACLTEP